MRGSFRTPGVSSLSWQDGVQARASDIRRMDITGFVGIAARGPINHPVRLESWNDFLATFGRPVEEGYLGHAVQGFFANGGRTCWIVRVADPETAQRADGYIMDPGGRPIVYFFATSAGVWGNDIRIDLAMRGIEKFDLSVSYPGGEFENWHNLSFDENERSFVAKVLRKGSNLVNAWVWPPSEKDAPHFIGTFKSDTGPAAEPGAGGIGSGATGERLRSTRLSGGTDGLAPGVNIPAWFSFREFMKRVAAARASEDRVVPLVPALHITPVDRGDTEARAREVGIEWQPAEEDGGDRDPQDFTLTITCAGSDAEKPDVEVPQLSMNPAAENYVVTAIAHHAKASGLIRVRDLNAWPGREFRPRKGPYRIGAGLQPEHFITLGAAPEPGSRDGEKIGLDTLGDIEEIGLIALPDIMPKPRIQPHPARLRCADPNAPRATVHASERGEAADFTLEEIRDLQVGMLRHCYQHRYRFAILDAPPFGLADRWSETAAVVPQDDGKKVPTEVEQVLSWYSGPDRRYRGPLTAYGALYFPWLVTHDEDASTRGPRLLPPSGHVAGVYARTDFQTGVHKSPANTGIYGAEDVTLEVDDETYGNLNVRGINVIRTASARGVRIGGARTLSPQGEKAWRYVSVRRLMSMVEKSIDKATQWTVFEPNDRKLWRAIDRVSREFLDRLWRQGMLDGATSESAYFVRCDETTNPPEQVDRGMIVCLVGLRPPWPAEFVTVRILKVADTTTLLGNQEVA